MACSSPKPSVSSGQLVLEPRTQHPCTLGRTGRGAEAPGISQPERDRPILGLLWAALGPHSGGSEPPVSGAGSQSCRPLLASHGQGQGHTRGSLWTQSCKVSQETQPPYVTSLLLTAQPHRPPAWQPEGQGTQLASWSHLPEPWFSSLCTRDNATAVDIRIGRACRAEAGG